MPTDRLLGSLCQDLTSWHRAKYSLGLDVSQNEVGPTGLDCHPDTVVPCRQVSLVGSPLKYKEQSRPCTVQTVLQLLKVSYVAGSCD